MPAFPFHSGCHLGRALRTVGAVTFIALMGVVSSAALGANPAEEMAKLGPPTGGIDPKGKPNEKDLTGWMCQQYFDVRVFGALMVGDLGERYDQFYVIVFLLLYCVELAKFVQRREIPSNALSLDACQR